MKIQIKICLSDFFEHKKKLFSMTLNLMDREIVWVVTYIHLYNIIFDTYHVYVFLVEFYNIWCYQ